MEKPFLSGVRKVLDVFIKSQSHLCYIVKGGGAVPVNVADRHGGPEHSCVEIPLRVIGFVKLSSKLFHKLSSYLTMG